MLLTVLIIAAFFAAANALAEWGARQVAQRARDKRRL